MKKQKKKRKEKIISLLTKHLIPQIHSGYGGKSKETKILISQQLDTSIKLYGRSLIFQETPRRSWSSTFSILTIIICKYVLKDKIIHSKAIDN
jgi:hypothetical protein